MILLTTAKCIKCGGSAIADTFEIARKLINHAVGLSRGIKCGDNYNMVQEIKSNEVTKTPKLETPKPVITKQEISKTEAPKPVVTNISKPITSSEKPKEKKQTKSSV